MATFFTKMFDFSTRGTISFNDMMFCFTRGTIDQGCPWWHFVSTDTEEYIKQVSKMDYHSTFTFTNKDKQQKLKKY